jgi:phosphate transport system protein
VGTGREHPTRSARPTFERQLEALQGAVTTLGEMVDKAIFRAADALQRRSEDGRIDRHRAGVEADVLHLLGQQHPAASDLRFVVAVLHMTTDLKRIGDHARNVARYSLSLSDRHGGEGGTPGPVLALPEEVPAMADLDRTRLREALAALRARDEGAAREIALRDAETDRLQDAAYHTLLTAMQAQPDLVPQATLLLRATYAFERTGDHVTNICERAIYAVSGQLEELNVFPGDRL